MGNSKLLVVLTSSMIQSLAKQTDLKRPGLPKVHHKPPICEKTVRKMYESTTFGLNDPEKLQNKGFLRSNAVLLSLKKPKSPSIQEYWFFIQHEQRWSTLRVQSNDRIKFPAWKIMKVSMKVWCMKNLVQIAFCGFLGAVSTPTKSLKRVFVSAPNWETSPLLRMFGTTAWWLESVHLVRKKIKIKIKKTYREKQKLSDWYQSIQSGRQLSQCLTSQLSKQQQGILWPKASSHKNEASIRSCSEHLRNDIWNPYSKMPSYSEELSVINSHRSSPVLNLSQQEVIISSFRSEITKNFSFLNCNVSIQ